MAIADATYAPTRLERDGLWLKDAITRALRGRVIAQNMAESTILNSKGVLVSKCTLKLHLWFFY